MAKNPSKSRADLSPSAGQSATLARFALEFAGIRLGGQNDGFFKRRLPALLEQSGFSSLGLYLSALATEEPLRKGFVEALTIHTTSFFRERRQYEWLAESGLPELAATRSSLVFWSAAASTGQEGWTALIVADQVRRQTTRSFRSSLIGTDLSTRVVAEAKRAVYHEDELSSVPEDLVRRHFMTARNGDGRVRITPELRALADWRQGNLSTGEGLAGIQSDVAFLRNVLIYFPEDVQSKVINRVVSKIKPGGYLLTGHSETGFSHPDLTVISPSIYKKATDS